MRPVSNVGALLRSALLVLVLVAAAQPGPGNAPDLSKRWAAGPPPATAQVMMPDLGKRWS